MARTRETTEVSGSRAVPKLTVPLAEAESQITSQIASGRRLVEWSIRSQDDLEAAKADLKKWGDANMLVLRRLFDSPEPWEEYSTTALGFVYPGLSLRQEIELYRKDVKRKITILESVKERLPHYEEAPLARESKEPAALETVLFLCRRFPIFARQLGERGHNRLPVEIEDEYDVQYLLLALLRLHFEDVRSEEWTPSYAGGSARMDFLLKPEKIVVEAKKTRTTLRDRDVADQLIIDIERYAQHADCDVLVCFVFDPEHMLHNPTGLGQDLSGPRENIDVRVVISPS